MRAIVFWITWIPLLVLCVVVLYLSLQRWRHASVLYGRVPLAFGMRTLGWTLRTANFKMLALPAAVLIWLAAIGAHSPYLGVHWVIVYAPGVLCLMAMLVLYATPPSVLLLGSSNSETVRLMTMLQAGFLVYRVVALLQKSAAARVVSFTSRSTFEGNNLRILGKHDWRTVVFPLADEVALIIVDTRFPSPAVIEEITRVLADDKLAGKSLFVVSGDGESEAKEACAGGMGAERQITRLKAPEVLAEAKRRGFFKSFSCPFDCPHHHRVCCKHITAAMRLVANAIGRLRVRWLNVVLKSVGLHRDVLPFAKDVERLIKRLEGRPGDGMAQAVAELDHDIVATEEFIGRWMGAPAFKATRMTAELQLVYRALLELQGAIDVSPPELVELIRRSNRAA